MKFSAKFLRKKAQGGYGGGFFSNSPIQKGKPADQTTESIDKYLRALQAAPETAGAALTPLGEQGTQGHKAPWQVYHDYPLSRSAWSTYDPSEDPGLMNNPKRRHYGLPRPSEKMNMNMVGSNKKVAEGICPKCGGGLTRHRNREGKETEICTRCQFGAKSSSERFNRYRDWEAAARRNGAEIELDGSGRTVAHRKGEPLGEWDPKYGGTGFGWLFAKKAALTDYDKEVLLEHLEGKTTEEVLDTIEAIAPGALQQFVHGMGMRPTASVQHLRRTASQENYGLRWQEFDKNDRVVTKEKWFPSKELREGFENKLQSKDSFRQFVSRSGSAKTAEEEQLWYAPYLEQLKQWGFQPDPSYTSEDGKVVSYNSTAADERKVKAYFKQQGFSNHDGRTYMAHTGNPHINLEKDLDGNSVQVAWFTRRPGPVGVTFLSYVDAFNHTSATKTARLITEKECRDWYKAGYAGGKIHDDMQCPNCGHSPIYEEDPADKTHNKFFCHACNKGFDEPKAGVGVKETFRVVSPDGSSTSFHEFLKGSAKKPFCPHCGSKKYTLMPADFETAKCEECGKTWEHGIVSGINDPSEKTSSLQGECGRIRLNAKFLRSAGRQGKTAGATNFSVVSEGKTAEEAYQRACQRATSEHGSNSYSGTIATTRGFQLLTPPPGVKPQKWAQWVDDFRWGHESPDWTPKDWRPVEYKDGQKCPATNIYQGAGKPPIKKCKGTIVAPPGQWPKCTEGHGLSTHGQNGKFYYDKAYPIKPQYMAQLERDSRVPQKWGPCAAVQLGKNKFLFFGIAAE